MGFYWSCMLLIYLPVLMGSRLGGWGSTHRAGKHEGTDHLGGGHGPVSMWFPSYLGQRCSQWSVNSHASINQPTTWPGVVPHCRKRTQGSDDKWRMPDIKGHVMGCISLVPRLSRNANMYRMESLVSFVRKHDISKIGQKQKGNVCALFNQLRFNARCVWYSTPDS